MKEKNIMTSKLGKVGRKKLPDGEKALRLNIWKQNQLIEKLGGKKEVERLLSEHFDTLKN